MRKALLLSIAALLINGPTRAQEAAPALPHEGVLAGSEAEHEPAEGLPEHLLYMENPGEGSVDTPQQVIAGQRRWQAGQILRVCFFGGDEVVRTLIAKTASEWSKYANLRFDFGPSPEGWDCGSPAVGFAHIRVGFGEAGYWSSVGNDSVKKLNQYQPSMNLQQFDVRYSRFNGYTPQNVVQKASASNVGTIYHEFAHAIAVLHEHQNANLNCWAELKKTGPGNVYDHYGSPPNNWSRKKTERNLGPVQLTDPDAISGAQDRTSIVMYVFPASVLIKGTASPCYIPERNIKISELDKKLVAKIYPAGAPANMDETEIGDLEFTSIPADSPEPLVDDFLQRVDVDLESSEPLIRRDARARLAQYLSDRQDPALVEQLVSELYSRSYRYQLGVAVAIGNSTFKDAISPGVSDTLRTVQTETMDPTLRDALSTAIGTTSPAQE